MNQHRISAGVGLTDVLPGLDFDAFAGGMFEASQSFGPLTNISIESYWLGIGFTWRFGRGDIERGRRAGVRRACERGTRGAELGKRKAELGSANGFELHL